MWDCEMLSSEQTISQSQNCFEGCWVVISPSGRFALLALLALLPRRKLQDKALVKAFLNPWENTMMIIKEELWIYRYRYRYIGISGMADSVHWLKGSMPMWREGKPNPLTFPVISTRISAKILKEKWWKNANPSSLCHHGREVVYIENLPDWKIRRWLD